MAGTATDVAFEAGREAFRTKSGANPYDQDFQRQVHAAWNDGYAYEEHLKDKAES